jgi:photosystem II stability/assembly factor-like uncharacterized protein
MLKRRSLFVGGLLFLGCPLVVQPAWAADWRLVGPYGGYIAELERCAASPEVVYARIFSGGVYRSSDGGATWSDANGELPAINFFDLVVDPSNPNSVWLFGILIGTSDLGLYHTKDGGAHWSAVSVPEGSLYLAVAPGNGAVVYASGREGLFKSVDRGRSWQRLPFFTTVPVAIDYANPSLLYAVGFGGVFVSTDGGSSWQPASSKPPGVGFLRTDPHQSGVLIGTTLTGFMRSMNGGRTWRPFGPRNLGHTAFIDLALGSGQPSDLLVVAPSVPTSLFAVDGRTGRMVRLPDPGLDFQASVISADPQHPGGILLGGPQGLRRTVNAGVSWSDSNHGLSGLYAGPIAVRGRTSFLAGNMRTENSGGHWSQFLPDQTVWALAVDPADRRIVYAATTPVEPGSATNYVWKSADGGSTWRPSSNGLDRAGLPTSLAVDARHPGTLYLSTESNGGLFQSRDAGASWQRLPLSPPFDVFHVELDSGKSGCLYIATGVAIQRSCDAGQTWTTLLNALFKFKEIAVAPSDPRWIYAAETDSFPGSPSLLWRSRDGGLSFDSSPLPGHPAAKVSLEVDPRDPEVVYLAVSGNSEDPGGVWRRRGDGPWEDLSLGLPSRGVGALKFDARQQPRLFASTGAGVRVLSLASEP